MVHYIHSLNVIVYMLHDMALHVQLELIIYLYIYYVKILCVIVLLYIQAGIHFHVLISSGYPQWVQLLFRLYYFSTVSSLLSPIPYPETRLGRSYCS